MKLIRGLHNLREPHRGCALTIGNFDGVHIGHQQLINSVCDYASDNALRACLVSFEPLPVEYFLPEEKRPHRLTNLRGRLAGLDASTNKRPLDQLLILRFNQALAETRASDFIKSVLIDGLNTKYLLIGDDFRFGKNREGTFATLSAASKEYGFELQQASTLSHGGERVSSSRIRSLLADGDLAAAAELLGRDYSLQGRVEYGAQLGRTLGYPTANIGLKKQNPPLRGVFAVEVSDHAAMGHDQHIANGIANIGVKPTVNGVRLSLEVHLLDTDTDLYGKRLNVTFLHKLRDEKKFTDLNELKLAIASDEQNARQWFTQRKN